MDTFDFEQLAEAAGGATPAALARAIGVTARTVYRWRHAGVIPADHADRAAVALGHHPAELWPSWATDTDWSAEP